MNFGTIQVTNIFVGALNAIEAYFGTEKVWGKSEPAIPNWLCFTAEEANSTVAMTAKGSAPTVSLEYSTDGNTWSPFVVGSTTVTIANIGDKVYMRAGSSGNTGMASSISNYNQFVMTGKIAASGNVDTLLDQNGNATLTRYCYHCLFSNCTSLTSAPELPATTLAAWCYDNMFNGCTSLTTAPELPATKLATSCYSGMFKGCSSLTQAPALPATTLATGCYANMFNGCTSLTTAPELPATKLATSCYSGMFKGCSSLTQAPALPATTLANDCYNRMFNDCSSLTQAPALPATQMASNCYYSMFYRCTSLTSAPALPATTLADSCYYGMFDGCSSLTTAPELPATTLAAWCYCGMFSGCASLTQAPALPVTTLADYCYYWMFSNCTALTQAPELPATTLADRCYYQMFYNCTSLNSIKVQFTNWAGDATSEWLPSNTGKFECPQALITNTTTRSANTVPESWTMVAYDAEPECLCFTAEQANSTLHLDKVGSPNAISLETSTDGNTWTDYSWTDKTGYTLTLANVGDKVYMRAKTENQTIGSSNTDYYKFVMTGKIASSGNIQALLKADCSRTDAPAYCYKNLFNGCQSLTTTQKLPATTLTESCYDNMFHGCTSLTTAPELPATKLADLCYTAMFYDCSSLTTAPELPATTLDYMCYFSMFNGCTNLNTIKLAYTGNFADSPNAFNNWVNRVSSTGTFYYNGSDTTQGVSAIPTGWTVTPFTS